MGELVGWSQRLRIRGTEIKGGVVVFRNIQTRNYDHLAFESSEDLVNAIEFMKFVNPGCYRLEINPTGIIAMIFSLTRFSPYYKLEQQMEAFDILTSGGWAYITRLQENERSILANNSPA